MKYAIPTSGGKLSQHFGQSTEFMIIEVGANGKISSKKTVSTIAHNCGSLPQLLSELGAKTVLAGGMGMGPRMAFESRGIEVVLGVAETDPEKAVLANINHTLVIGQNTCGHPDEVCDHSEGQTAHEGSCH
jgi:predicted Fe-Mo cluster-binding NifX family protein